MEIKVIRSNRFSFHVLDCFGALCYGYVYASPELYKSVPPYCELSKLLSRQTDNQIKSKVKYIRNKFFLLNYANAREFRFTYKKHSVDSINAHNRM